MVSFNTNYAQLPTIYWTEQDIEKDMPTHSLLLSNGHIVNIYQFGQRHELAKIHLKEYDENNKLFQEVDYKSWAHASWKPSKYVLQSVKVVDDRVCLLLTQNEGDKWMLYKNILGKDLKAGKDLVHLGEINAKIKKKKINFFYLIIGILTLSMVSLNESVYDNQNGIYLNQIYSRDQSKHFCYKIETTKNDAFINGICFDYKLNKLFTVHQPLENGDRDKSYIYNAVIKNNGDIILGFTQFFKKKTHKEKKKLGIAKISNNGKSYKSKIFEEEKKAFMLAGSLSPDESKFYSFDKLVNAKLDTRIDGFYLDGFNLTTMTMDKRRNYLIDDDFLAKVYNTKEAKQNKIGKRGMKNNWREFGTFVYDDHSVAVALQEFDDVKHYSTDSKGNRYQSGSTYTYGDILILKFGEYGKLTWSTIFYKNIYIWHQFRFLLRDES